ncbi:hypothetical protein CXB51_001657 [Gossypium anomalum]|uniref:Uncharacterized protein n=1 Tax=Gossypium anomalum TaxID=47600 RepID=A0A8J6DDG2_9ROSI|nr:hypothetical protein CXB51_001657 [Gossypium anomalum]
MSLDSIMDKVNELFNSHRDKLSEGNDALKAMMMALKEETMATTMALSTRREELEVELALCRAAVGEGLSSAALNNKYVPKLKEFMRTRSACDAGPQIIRKVRLGRGKSSNNGLKQWVRQEVEQRCVQKLLEAITVAESMVKLGLGKDKLGFSKSQERGVCEKDHKEDNDGNGIGANGGNGKPRIGKKKPNRKRDKLKYFLCDDPHMLKKCLKKYALKKPMGKALVLGSSRRGVEAKKVESEKKQWSASYVMGKVEAKRAKRRKKKRVKCLLCRGLHELRNCPKQAVVNGKAMFELGESLEGLPPKEKVSLSSNLGEKVAMKIMKLGPMRLNLSEASELA